MLFFLRGFVFGFLFFGFINKFLGSFLITEKLVFRAEKDA